MSISCITNFLFHNGSLSVQSLAMKYTNWESDVYNIFYSVHGNLVLIKQD